jgi:hypothetical protein
MALGTVETNMRHDIETETPHVTWATDMVPSMVIVHPMETYIDPDEDWIEEGQEGFPYELCIIYLLIVFTMAAFFVYRTLTSRPSDD